MQVADPIADSRKTAAFSYLQGSPQYARNSDRGSFTRAGKNGELLKGNLEVAKTLALELNCCATSGLHFCLSPQIQCASPSVPSTRSASRHIAAPYPLIANANAYRGLP